MSTQLPPARTAVFYVGQDGVPLFTRVWYRYFEAILAAIGGSASSAADDDTLLMTAPPIVPFDLSMLPALLVPEQSKSDRDGLAEALAELQKQVDGITSALNNLAEVRDQLYELQKVVTGLQSGVTI